MPDNGFLKLPKLDTNKFYIDGPDQYSELFVIYHKYLDSAEGQKVLNQITQDARTNKYVGKMISHGGASMFSHRELAIWYLFNLNEYGSKTADAKLNRFLDDDKYKLTQALWLMGVTIEDRIELADGYSLVPIEMMPTCCDKEKFSQVKFDAYSLPRPCKVILLKETEATTIFEMNFDKRDHTKTFEIMSKMAEIAKLINCIGGSHCAPAYSTSYAFESPFWPFSGRGGGSEIHDVFGIEISKFDSNNKDLLNELIKNFVPFSKEKKEKYHIILDRLSQSKRRQRIEDKILDLAIALEMILLENSNKEQLALSFRLRGSYLISENESERKEVYETLKRLYNHRSEVAHTGTLCSNNQEKIKAVRESFPKFVEVADRIVQKSIIDGIPNWDDLILGVAKV